MMQEANLPTANVFRGLTLPQAGGGAAWGRQNTLNVNVNSTEAGDIAEKLVTEMRHSGVRF
jgi:hypothetical protein